MIEVHSFSASRWGCWRCGRTFSGEAPYGIKTLDNSSIIHAPVCRSCIEDREYRRDLFIWAHIRDGEPVWWKFRLSLAWKILTGRFGQTKLKGRAA